MILDKVDKLLTNCKDYHLPICTFVFCAGAVLQWWHHMDRDFIAYTVVVLGAITGHAFSPSQRDQPGDPH